MRKILRITTLAALALGATALTAQAQDKATELSAGLIGFSSASYDDALSTSLSTFATGGGYLAVGFYLSPSLAIEPTIQFASVSSSDDLTESSSVSTLGLALAFPYYFQKGWGRKGWYVAPRLGYTSFDCTDCSGVSQFDLGVGVGTKVPLNDMAALRVQGSFDYGFENEDTVSSTTFGISLGLSVFLK